MMFPRARGVASMMGGGAAAAAFSPTEIDGLKLWFDFSDSTTLFTDAGSTPVASDGDLIYQINDKSGGGVNAVQATESKRPTYKVNIQNGLSIGRLDGSSDTMQTASVSLGAYCCVFAVYKANSATRLILEQGPDVNSNPGMYYLVRAANAMRVRRTNDRYNTGNFSSTVFTISMGRYDNGAFILRQNGVDVTGSDLGTIPTDTACNDVINIGSRNQASLYFAGDLGEIIYYDDPLTVSQYEAVEVYLSDKWGVSLS